MNSEIIDFAHKKNIIINQEGLTLLNNHNYKPIIEELSKQQKLFVGIEDIRKCMSKKKNLFTNAENTNKNNDYDTNDEKHFYIMDKYDITNKKLSKGSVEDFRKLFLDKYETISQIIKKRPNFNAITISNAKKELKSKKVDIIGMVYSKRSTQKGNILINVDDPTGSINLVLMNKDEKDFLKQKEILLDNVLGFKCSVINKNIFIINEVIYPDIPYNQRDLKFDQDKYLAIIADVHLGSKLFLEKEFSEFIDWLNLKNEENKEIVNNIKYLVIAGDLVDGIGIYPKQFDELVITDIFEQYKAFEEYILKIPKNIEIFITPGNHDAVRLSDPQPALPKKYLPRLYERENIHMIGSPSWVNIEGYKTIIYHGAAMHGIYANIKEATMDKPHKAIKEILKRRDLMPQYGDRQTFVPIEKNFMTIKETPDIYIGGDVHHHGYENYKGCHIINASCWQAMTAYQKEKGHIPTLAKVILFNFKNEKITIKDFYNDKEKKEI